MHLCMLVKECLCEIDTSLTLYVQNAQEQMRMFMDFVFNICVLACSLCCSCGLFAKMCVHAPTRKQMAGFKDLTKEKAMAMPASARDQHCGMYRTLNAQTKAMLKDCSTEVSKALALAKDMCSGTSK